MRKQLFLYALALATLGCVQEKKAVRITGKVTPLAALPIGNNDSVQGVSAPFAGLLNGELFVAGGCNFPGEPASRGGVKEYYSDIYRYDSLQHQWQAIGQLPRALAYGASVVSGDEWICLGGNNKEGAYTSVYTIRYNGQLHVDTLPSLPATMDNFAATLQNGKIYAGGGNVNGKVQNKCYMLDLSTRKAWVELPDFPGAGRVQPQLLQGRAGGIVLLGGFQAGSLTELPVLSSEVYAWEPQSNTWSLESELPLSAHDQTPPAMVGGFGVSLNDSVLLIGGGVNRARFIEALDAGRQIEEAIKAGQLFRADSLSAAKSNYLTHPVEWYQFNTELYTYHIQTRQWQQIGTYSPTARAGAGVVYRDGVLFIVGGELKPGIRTDEVNSICID
ncbi:MAG: cyclically-permuted mutarotase family protein [Bacteroidales bacterium]